MAHKLTPGDAAPDFRLAADDDREVTLGDFRGRWLVLFFFPKALTPG
jgi:thioredoxin-dependent peroxiredoxin